MSQETTHNNSMRKLSRSQKRERKAQRESRGIAEVMRNIPRSKFATKQDGKSIRKWNRNRSFCSSERLLDAPFRTGPTWVRLNAMPAR